ncbi:pyruvate kinase [Methanoculleus taiwanensis]|uniref:Pyruvate kinase n=1 Tax=Methanoculleus taiwanensis TaxID=1550565 RepID=A0A498H5K3_9EURY|nr:pyruvate kinase [Methanoculleus taiwanensis]RXE57180.1 pyruvate kinase [Methanoculleus taiwanensis]
MQLPDHKTKIVCTIGPASDSVPVLKEMVEAGMNVARLNLSHGTFDEHRKTIRNVRRAADEAGRLVSILIDLPGPKLRIGTLPEEPMQLAKGEVVTLTTKKGSYESREIPVDFSRFADLVSEGSIIYLNDGFIQLRVTEIVGEDVRCQVVIGGPLLSHKGMSLIGGEGVVAVSAVTDRDLECIDFGLAEGLDTFSISFIQNAADIDKARNYAAEKGKAIHIISKIERQEALANLDEILAATDGVMIARGDLGVQIPIEEVPAVQKRIILKATTLGRPVITATQMLESMTDNIRPTRAEVTDVANAILDGTDAVMLSGETSVGHYPVEAVGMMVKIARNIEERRSSIAGRCGLVDYFRRGRGRAGITISDVVSLNVIESMEALGIRYVLTPTRSGATPRHISRFKPDSWILSFTRNPSTHKFLAFSYGVYSVFIRSEEEYWHGAMLEFIRESGVIRRGEQVVLTEGISPSYEGTDSLIIFTVD